MKTVVDDSSGTTRSLGLYKGFQLNEFQEGEESSR